MDLLEEEAIDAFDRILEKEGMLAIQASSFVPWSRLQECEGMRFGAEGLWVARWIGSLPTDNPIADTVDPGAGCDFYGPTLERPGP